MKALLLVSIANILASAIDIVAIAAVSLYLNLAVLKVSLFICPKLIRLEKWGITFELGSIPVGSRIEFYTRENQPPVSQRGSRNSEAAGAEKILFEWLHPLEKGLVILSGAIAIFTITSLILTPQTASASILAGFEQIIRGSLDSEYAKGLIERIYTLLAQQPIWVIISILLTKFLALNLLPIPPFHGGAILQEILRFICRRNFEVPSLIVEFSCLIALALMLRWLLIVIAFCIVPIFSSIS